MESAVNKKLVLVARHIALGWRGRDDSEFTMDMFLPVATLGQLITFVVAVQNLSKNKKVGYKHRAD